MFKLELEFQLGRHVEFASEVEVEVKVEVELELQVKANVVVDVEGGCQGLRVEVVVAIAGRIEIWCSGRR